MERGKAKGKINSFLKAEKIIAKGPKRIFLTKHEKNLLGVPSTVDGEWPWLKLGDGFI